MDNLSRIKHLSEMLDELEHSEAAIAAFFDLCPDLMAIADENGYFVKLNKYWTIALGWSIEELTNRTWSYYLHPDDMHKTMQTFNTMLSGQIITNFVNRYRKSDGSYVTISWNASGHVDRKHAYCIGRIIGKEKP